MTKKLFLILFNLIILLYGCQSNNQTNTISPTSIPPTATSEAVSSLPVREQFSPGELVDYFAQPGDTIQALANHFNTSELEILSANPIIPEFTTTLPAGLPMQIPIYYRSFWGSTYQVLPDSLYIYGPSTISFETQRFIEQYPGWLNNYSAFADGKNRNAAEIIDLIAINYSVSPKLLIALIEFYSGGLSKPVLSTSDSSFILGYQNPDRRGLYQQLNWAANLLNNGYYGWRGGDLFEFERLNGTIERLDPWQNAASVGFHLLFNDIFEDEEEYLLAIGPNGLAQTYLDLFGDPWRNEEAHIPGSLTQPNLILPFKAGATWAYTGGPHSGWGHGAPLAALDFSSSSSAARCIVSPESAIAIADGLVVRSETGIVVLDLDGDGDERTGWVIFYLHLATLDRAEEGVFLNQGDPVGHPSCERGIATGSHVHLARKYNGEWINADSVLAFTMEGWIPKNGNEPYEGSLIRYNEVVTACECGDADSQITSEGINYLNNP